MNFAKSWEVKIKLAVAALVDPKNRKLTSSWAGRFVPAKTSVFMPPTTQDFDIDKNNVLDNIIAIGVFVNQKLIYYLH